MTSAKPPGMPAAGAPGPAQAQPRQPRASAGALIKAAHHPLVEHMVPEIMHIVAPARFRVQRHVAPVLAEANAIIARSKVVSDPARARHRRNAVIGDPNAPLSHLART